MLLGQNLSGGHHGALPAALPGQPGAGGGHRRLARAHVALHQPVHGSPGGHVRRRLVHGTALGAGEGEGQQGQKRRQIPVLHRRTGTPVPSCAQQRHAAGEKEKLLKNQPPPCNLQGLPALREVDIPAGELHLGQAVTQTHLLGQQLGHLSGAGVHAPPGQPGQQVVGDARRQGVDRHDAAGEPGGSLPLEHRVGHLPLPALPLHLAVEDVALPLAQGVPHIGLVKEGDGHHRRLVGHLHLDQLQPLADVGHPGRLRHKGRHAHRLFLGCGVNGGDFGPVLVAAGVVPQQILHSGQTQLGQFGGSGVADARQFLQAALQRQRHGTPPLSQSLRPSLP